MAMRNPAGRRVGEFVIEHKLGEGGSAEAWIADQPALQRQVVLKLFRAQRSSAAVTAAVDEARLACRLEHPYAAHVYGVGVEPDGLIWIAMEHVRGVGLRDLVAARGPLRLDRFVPVFERLCEVVHAAHERDIVHGDIKPSNVIVVASAGRLLPKLIDFGLARLVELGAGEQDRRPVGSPAYMAPELWSAPATPTRSSDLYALGVLTYETLTGRLPFDATTARELAIAHAEQPVPPISGPPGPVDQVVARALAKRSADRFASALELAGALRIASGIDSDRAPVPPVDEAASAMTRDRAPQPLAEAVAAIDAARTVHQASEALGAAVDIAARWIGLVALACRGAVDARVEPYPADAVERIRLVHRADLPAAGWLELARALIRPLAQRPEACPLPELVPLLASSDRLVALDELAHRSRTGILDEAQVRGELAGALPRLADALRELSPLFGYSVAVARGRFGELWNGIRRPERLATLLGATDQADGSVLILDAEGAAVLCLSPLVQVDRPIPGEAEEMFLFAGGSSGCARLVAAHGFERRDDSVWSWFRDRLLAEPGGAAGATADAESSPYLGLQPFTSGDAPRFVGREREAEVLANRLRTQSLIAVVGPSGAGKSSLVQAGLVPRLPGDWNVIIVRPGPSPEDALRARLGPAAGGSGTLADTLIAAARAVDRPLVVVIDQFEELFTLCRDAEQRERYAAGLVGAADASDRRVRIVLTLRDDFLIRAAELAALRDRLGPALQLIATPTEDCLVRILVEPCRQVGYDFDDPELPREMARSVAGQPGALALLSFTADRLWELRDRSFRQLRRRAHDALGGVGGALARHAERTLERLPAEPRRLVREVFRHLVTADCTRAALPTHELSQLLGGGDRAGRVIEDLVAARLLVVAEAEDGTDRIEIAHEALLAAWPRLAGWQREDRDGARLRDQLRSAARQWEERGRGRDLLWRGDALAEYRLWRDRHGGELTTVEAAFARASVSDEAKRRRIRTGLIAAAITILALGIAILLRVNDEARRQRAVAQDNHRRAEDQFTASLVDSGRRALLSGRSAEAALFLVEAQERGASGPALALMLRRASDAVDAQKLAIDGGGGKVRAAVTRDGARIVSASDTGKVRVWDGTTGAPLRVLADLDYALAPRLSPDGRLVAVTGREVSLWEIETGRTVAVLRDPDNRDPPSTTVLEFSRDGALVVAVASRDRARLWHSSGALASRLGDRSGATSADFGNDQLAVGAADGRVDLYTSDGRHIRTLEAHTARVLAVRFSPAGDLLVTASEDGKAALWRTRDGARLHLFEGHLERVWSAEFDPAARRIVTASADGTARLWDAGTGRLIAELLGHDTTVFSAVFSPDGRRVVTASGDGSARIWDPEPGIAVASLEGHRSVVRSAVYTGDGRRIVTASYDGTIRVWQVPDGGLTAVADATSPRGVALSPDGARLARADGPTVELSRIDSGDARRLTGHPETVRGVTFDRSSSLLASWSEDGTARVWRIDGGGEPAVLGHAGAVADVAFLGDRVVTATDAGEVTLWRTDGERLGSVALAGGKGERGDPPRLLVATGRVAALHDGRVTAWDDALQPLMSVGKRDPEFSPHDTASAALAPDGRLLATGHFDGSVKLWTAPGGALVAERDGHSGTVQVVQFSPDGRMIASGGQDGVIRLWSAAGEPVSALRGQVAAVTALAFRADGALLFAGHDRGLVSVWDVGAAHEIDVLRARRAPVNRLELSRDGAHLLVVAGTTGFVWNTQGESRGLTALRALVDCRVPYELRAGLLWPRDAPDCAPAPR